MKGVVFNIFESFIVENFSEEAWEEVLEQSNIDDDVFVGPKTYDDATFLALVTTAVKLKGLDFSQAVRLFGKYSFSMLRSKMITLVDQFQTPEELLLNLDGIIHVEVRKLLENANPPKFEVRRVNDALELKYYSTRNLCIFLEGLLDGLAAHYNMKVKYEQTTCTHRGDEFCTFKIEFYN